jgi:hypothetical protein
MNAWHTMETAPRDGTPFLAWHAEGIDGEPHWAVCYYGVDGWLCYDTGGVAADDRDDDFRPTHWTHLPAPPETTP